MTVDLSKPSVRKTRSDWRQQGQANMLWDRHSERPPSCSDLLKTLAFKRTHYAFLPRDCSSH